MDILKTMGAVAGIGGLALGVYLLLNKDFLRRFFESFPGVTRTHAFQLLRLFLILTWSIAVIGIIAFVVLELQSKSILPTPLVPTPTPTPVVIPVPTPTPAPPPPKPEITSEFVVCSGEYERNCPAHHAYIYCYVDPATEAAKSCKRYSVKTSQSKGGNKCGYTWTTFICVNEVP